MLNQAGIEAHVTEDLSVVGLWVGGTVPGIHTPKVWVDQDDAERATAILQEQQQREEALRQDSESTADVEVACEECGQTSTFPAAQRGSVQQCPDCGAYVDVEEGGDDDWPAGEESDQPPDEDAEA